MSKWIRICHDDDLIPGSGICALVGKHQVAIFKTRKDDAIYAIDNYDPIGKANVLSRGITGSIGDQIVVASPLYKQHFNLVTGQCLEDSNHSVTTYTVKKEGGNLFVQTPS